MEKEHIHSITSITHSFPHSKNHIVAGWTMAISTEVCRRLFWAATEVPKFPSSRPTVQGRNVLLSTEILQGTWCFTLDKLGDHNDFQNEP
jgi:hypothetical protein